MVKRVVWYSVLVIVLLTVSAGTVMAGKGGGGGGGGGGDAPKGSCVFALVGQVVSVDYEAESITVQVLSGNRLVQDYIDTALTVTTTSETRFWTYGESDCVPGAFEDVVVGTYVSVGGCVDPVDGFVAERVTVNAAVECLR